MHEDPGYRSADECQRDPPLYTKRQEQQRN